MSDHRLEQRQAEYTQSYCVEPSCEFCGDRAQQGVCYSADPEMVDAAKVMDAAERFAKELLQIRSRIEGDEYVTWLEAMYECSMMNWTMTLDECVRLRAENARLKRELKK